MTDSKSNYDVVVIGAGISGIIGAYELAIDHDVLVIDQGRVANDATSRASGLISTPQVFPDMPAFGAYAIDFFEKFSGTGIFSYKPRRKIQPVLNGGEAAARQHAQEQSEQDNPVHYYDPHEFNERFPNVARLDALEGYDGVLEYERTGMIDPMDYAHSLKNQAKSRGAEFRTDTEVLDVLVDNDVVAGVETEYGRVHAPKVVCAAGWRTNELLADHAELPVRPFRWQAVEVKLSDGLPTAYPMGSETSMEVYWRPINGDNLLIGGRPITVGSPASEPSTITDSFQTMVREQLPELLPVLEDATIVREECCPTGDSATPDALPIYDTPADAPDGLVIATGFQKGGIMSSPCTGAAIRSLVADEPAPFSLEPFQLSRFDDRSSDFPLMNIYTAFRES
ncbi:NAD(P)/FAD-dependent oxidoreductase [Natribaculum luteum]|uniref:NAD(P)/FAD-dependent oxidoreductase n=1 Tax=Natribaculum luteum TaxID=1586232 RepID=A0ABD5P4D6_9EURY|nr:FAD-binding oxidoreductase [Natribaculum luteum]